MRVPVIKHQKGVTSVIVVVLIGSFLMTALLIGLQQTNMATYELTDSQDRLKALYLAESALERAAFRYQTIACTSLPEAAISLGDGTIELSSAVSNGSACDIEVKAVVGDAIKKLAASLANTSGGYDAWAVGKSGVIIGRSAGVWAVVSSNVSKELKGVSCSDANYCVAVGKEGWVTVWNGSVWTASQIEEEEKYNAISCSPTDVNLCVIVGKGDTAEGVIRIWDRSSGTPGSIKYNANKELKAVACPGATCVAVGKKETNSYVTRGNASSWTAESSDVGEEIKGVSCTDTGAVNCWGVAKKAGNNFRLAQRPGSGSSDWEEITGKFGAGSSNVNNLDAISCVTSGICWAVGKRGHALKFDGGWSYVAQISSRDQKGISCRENDGTCLSVGKNGSVVYWPGTGTTWSTEATVTGHELKGVTYFENGSSGGGVNVQNWQEVVSGS